MKREIWVPKNTKETKAKNSLAISQLFSGFLLAFFYLQCSFYGPAFEN